MSAEVWGALQGFIAATGFPIFVAVYVLVRMERAVHRNTDALNDVAAMLRQQRNGHSYEPPRAPRS